MSHPSNTQEKILQIYRQHIEILESDIQKIKKTKKLIAIERLIQFSAVWDQAGISGPPPGLLFLSSFYFQ
jgi:hypothetical protein